jgi:hypothetical protein
MLFLSASTTYTVILAIALTAVGIKYTDLEQAVRFVVPVGILCWSVVENRGREAGNRHVFILN